MPVNDDARAGMARRCERRQAELDDKCQNDRSVDSHMRVTPQRPGSPTPRRWCPESHRDEIAGFGAVGTGLFLPSRVLIPNPKLKLLAT